MTTRTTYLPGMTAEELSMAKSAIAKRYPKLRPVAIEEPDQDDRQDVRQIFNSYRKPIAIPVRTHTMDDDSHFDYAAAMSGLNSKTYPSTSWSMAAPNDEDFDDWASLLYTSML